MGRKKVTNILLKVSVAIFLILSLLLTFTVSDYYIFSRISLLNGENTFSIFFVLSQWIKKVGILILPLAVFYNKKSCSDIAKYVLPLFIVVSCFTFGSFFDLTMLTESATGATKVFASINEFIPKQLNMAMFFMACIFELISCVLIFVRDGFKAKLKSFVWLPVAFLAVLPLNLFENFYDRSKFDSSSFLYFKSFSLWHFIAFGVLIGATIGIYFFLRKKDKQLQSEFLIAIAITLLIQYHSKASIIMSDGYGPAKTIFDCMPLYICNIGTYVASLSVILKKRVLYAISFFVHAAGALIVFCYTGRVELSQFGIFCGYSALYFCLSHLLLFMLCVLPTALGHYKFKIKDCIIPLIYYCLVIVIAAISSAAITSASMNFSYDGYTLSPSEWILPNYSFTQQNPLPIELFKVPFKIFNYEFNLLYLIILYIVYVGLFWGFIGGYYLFLEIRKKVLLKNLKQKNT